jgi:hypothetical protein
LAITYAYGQVMVGNGQVMAGNGQVMAITWPFTYAYGVVMAITWPLPMHMVK